MSVTTPSTIVATPQSGHHHDTTYFSMTDTLKDSPSTLTINPDTHTASERHPPKKEETIRPVQSLAFIPHRSHGRTLILCFDGTGDKFDKDNSNVVQFLSLLKKHRKDQQRVYYQSGIGTYDSPTAANPITRKMSKVLDLMVAWDLDRHVMDGYRFLMQNYTHGDKICIFGFSRGAYTARSLAGMLHKVGLLPAGNIQQVTSAYKLYKRTDRVGWDMSNAFKKACSIDVGIEFVGVWDTVDSVGLIPKRLPFTTSNTIIKTFRHAISLDEHRAKFKPNLWHRTDPKDHERGWSHNSSRIPVQPTSKVVSNTQQIAEPVTPSEKTSPISTVARQTSVTSQSSDIKESPRDDLTNNTSGNSDPMKEMKWAALGKAYARKEHAETDVLEVWFAGCHCDVGGGSVGNDVQYSLSRIPLRWMVRECFKANTGIMFEVDGLRRLGMDPNSLYPIVTERPKPLSGKGHVLFKCGAEPRVESSDSAKVQDKKISTLARQMLPELKESLKNGEQLFFDFDENDKAKSWEDKYAIIEGKLVNSDQEYVMVRTEEEEELMDALSPVYDQLELAKGWWALEYIPLSARYSAKERDQWVAKSKLQVNRGRPREIPGPGIVTEKTKQEFGTLRKGNGWDSNGLSQLHNGNGHSKSESTPAAQTTKKGETIKVHRSVGIRVEAHIGEAGSKKTKTKRYKPKAWFSSDVEIEYVD